MTYIPQQEGEWTATVADAASGGNTGSTATGTYIRIGNLVCISVQIIDIDTSGLTSGNDFYIQGLPFDIKSGYNFFGSARYDTFATPSSESYDITPEFRNGASSMLFRRMVRNSGDTTVKVSDITDDTSDVYVSGSYITDDA